MLMEQIKALFLKKHGFENPESPKIALFGCFGFSGIHCSAVEKNVD